MSSATIIALVTVMAMQAIRALYSSLKKERTMVKEGGDPLPTSVWVFLLIEVIVAPLLTWGLAVLATPILALFPGSVPWSVVLVALIYGISVFVSRVISVIIATITRLFLVRKYSKQIEGSQEQQVAEQIRKSFFGE